MERNSKSRSMPPNVYNYTYRVLGIEYWKAIGIISTVAVSSAIARFSLLSSLFILISGLFATLARIGGTSPLHFALKQITCFAGGRGGTVMASFRILEREEGYVIADERYLYLIEKIESRNVIPETLSDSSVSSISRLISGLHSDFEVLTVPSIIDSGTYKVDGQTEDVEDYNGMITFALDRCYYVNSYFVLKRPHRVESETLDVTRIKEESEKVRSAFSILGLDCFPLSSEDEIAELLKVMQ